MSEDVAQEISESEAPVQPETQGKMVSQSEVEKIVHAKIMRERERASMGGVQSQPQGQGFNRDELLKEAAQMMQKQMDEQRATYERDAQKAEVDKIAQVYLEEMEKGKDLYDDFEEVTSDFSPAAFPQVTIMASRYADVLPEIMYELGKNPQKLANLHTLAISSRPMAEKAMKKLVESIKGNEQAIANNQKSPAPLNKMKASANAGQDTGKRTIKDMRKDPRYKV